jgi:hypothetical protein
VVTSTHRTTKTYGTLNHMAPERLARGFLAPAGDVYAWGIMSECCALPCGAVQRAMQGPGGGVSGRHRFTWHDGPASLLNRALCRPRARPAVWELWTGETAFEGQHMGQVCAAVVVRDDRPAVPPDMPPDYTALMQACWAREPEARPSMSEVKDELHAMRESMSAPHVWVPHGQQQGGGHPLGDELAPPAHTEQQH